MEIRWFFRCEVIRCGHGRYWRMYQEAKAFAVIEMNEATVPFSKKQLKDLLDELNRRYKALPRGRLKN